MQGGKSVVLTLWGESAARESEMLEAWQSQAAGECLVLQCTACRVTEFNGEWRERLYIESHHEPAQKKSEGRCVYGVSLVVTGPRYMLQCTACQVTEFNGEWREGCE